MVVEQKKTTHNNTHVLKRSIQRRHYETNVLETIRVVHVCVEGVWVSSTYKANTRLPVGCNSLTSRDGSIVSMQKAQQLITKTAAF